MFCGSVGLESQQTTATSMSFGVPEGGADDVQA